MFTAKENGEQKLEKRKNYSDKKVNVWAKVSLITVWRGPFHFKVKEGEDIEYMCSCT
jgi:hypothetical protein